MPVTTPPSPIEEASARRRLPPPPARRQIRETAGVSKRSVARFLNVSGQAVSHWENGSRQPLGPNVVRYAALLEALAELDGPGQ